MPGYGIRDTVRVARPGPARGDPTASSQVVLVALGRRVGDRLVSRRQVSLRRAVLVARFGVPWASPGHECGFTTLP